MEESNHNEKESFTDKLVGKILSLVFLFGIMVLSGLAMNVIIPRLFII